MRRTVPQPLRPRNRVFPSPLAPFGAMQLGSQCSLVGSGAHGVTRPSQAGPLSRITFHASRFTFHDLPNRGNEKRLDNEFLPFPPFSSVFLPFPPFSSLHIFLAGRPV